MGTVPGNGTKEPNGLDPYLDIFVDELLAISDKDVFDAYQGAPFKLKTYLDVRTGLSGVGQVV